MTPEEEAYEEALRRILKAEETEALKLDLGGWNQTEREYTGLEALTHLPPELECLTSLRSLDLSRCYRLHGDLSPLAGLTSLQSLELAACEQLSDLSPLAGLTKLQPLDLSGCDQLSDLSPLAGLTSLQKLNLAKCSEVKKFSSLEPLLPRLLILYLYCQVEF